MKRGRKSPRDWRNAVGRRRTPEEVWTCGGQDMTEPALLLAGQRGGATWIVLTAVSGGGSVDAAACQRIREQYAIDTPGVTVLFDPTGETNSVLGMRVNTVFPRALESNANAAVGMLFEALKGERRSRDVTTQALETLTVATVHRDGGVDVDATDFGECARTGAPHEAKWADELRGLAARCRTEQLNVPCRRAVARREDRLVSRRGQCSLTSACRSVSSGRRGV